MVWAARSRGDRAGPARRPGRCVDDLADFRPRQVYAGGQLVAEGGTLRPDVTLTSMPACHQVGSSVKIAWAIVTVDIRLPAASSVRVIGSLPDQLVTEDRILPVLVVGRLCRRRSRAATC